MARVSASTVAVMRAAHASAETTARYRALVSTKPLQRGCLVWTGAISGRGHGRFWLGRTAEGRSVAVIAHRWSWALAHGIDSLLNTTVVRHVCDNPLCQCADHLVAGQTWENTAEAYARRELIGNPLRDIRGARGRARALRDAARLGADLHAVDVAGLPEVDRYQAPLEGL